MKTCYKKCFTEMDLVNVLNSPNTWIKILLFIWSNICLSFKLPPSRAPWTRVLWLNPSWTLVLSNFVLSIKWLQFWNIEVLRPITRYIWKWKKFWLEIEEFFHWPLSSVSIQVSSHHLCRVHCVSAVSLADSCIRSVQYDSAILLASSWTHYPLLITLGRRSPTLIQDG